MINCCFHLRNHHINDMKSHATTSVIETDETVSVNIDCVLQILNYEQNTEENKLSPKLANDSLNNDDDGAYRYRLMNLC